MAEFKPSRFSAALVLLIPTYKTEMGVANKIFPSPSKGFNFYGSFKTYGGTEHSERDVNGLYSIMDTANIECWYNPSIKSDCRIYVQDTGATYEIMNEPEDIELRHMFMKFKVRRIKGGV